jgi:hypothetical protein
MDSANLPRAVRDYLSKRGRIAGRAGRGECKWRCLMSSIKAFEEGRLCILQQVIDRIKMYNVISVELISEFETKAEELRERLIKIDRGDQ